MSLFKELLKEGESLFRDTVFLSYDFRPKLLKYRENEQQQFATAIRPLLQKHNGRNLFVYGPAGVGKTTACKHVLRELEEETDEVVPLYINCWKENTTFKIYSKICLELGFKFLVNKKSSELFEMIKEKLNKSSVVFIFDEIDKLEEVNFLYAILEDIYRKSIFLITNYRDSYSEMDERIRSRLNPEFIFFRAYNQAEITGILKQRRDYAFVPGCWDEDAFKEITEKATEVKDVRIGLYLMREAGNLAEEKASRRIEVSQVAEAIKKVDDFHIKPREGLDEELSLVLNLVKEHTGQKVGDLYNFYSEKGGEMSYKTFRGRISKLEGSRFLSTEKVSGREGHSTLVHYAAEKKLTEF